MWGRQSNHLAIGYELSFIWLEKISPNHPGIATHQEIVMELVFRHRFMQKTDASG